VGTIQVRPPCVSLQTLNLVVDPDEEQEDRVY
jgi:hypothetical protein